MLNKNLNLLWLVLLIVIIVVGVRYFGQQDNTSTDINNLGIEIPEGQTINNIPKDKVTTVPIDPSGSNLPSMTEDGKYLVYYFDEGFSPNILQIKKGTSVRFINKSDSSMMIYASNQDLAIYRAFNQLNSVGKEEVYNYTFNETGVYPYFNYNNQSNIANILVY